MKTLILINGLKRSGKDYTASIIQNLTGASIISFADPLKQIMADTFNISLEKMDKYKNDGVTLFSEETNGYKEELINFRTLLQRFGTEAMKPVFGNDVWARIGISKAIKQKSDFVVMPDFRFMVEGMTAKEMASSLNFKVVFVHIYNKDLKQTDLHSSETELRDNEQHFDYYINNTGKPNDIEEKVKEILSSLRKQK